MKLFFRKPVIELDTRSKIETATGKLNEAFIMFQQAYDAIEDAQSNLTKTIEDSDKIVQSLQAKLESELSHQQIAKDAMVANDNLKSRLQDFIIK